MQLPGLIVAPLTPFKPKDLSIDWSALERQIDYICNDCTAAMVSVAAAMEIAAPNLDIVDLPRPWTS